MQSCLSSYETSWKGSMTTAPRGELAGAEASLSSALGAGAVITASAAFEAYAADAYWPALAAKAAGTPLARPDVVVRPRTEEEVATVLEIADERRLPVVPWGGGSGTQGALPLLFNRNNVHGNVTRLWIVLQTIQHGPSVAIRQTYV